MRTRQRAQEIKQIFLDICAPLTPYVSKQLLRDYTLTLFFLKFSSDNRESSQESHAYYFENLLSTCKKGNAGKSIDKALQDLCLQNQNVFPDDAFQAISFAISWGKTPLKKKNEILRNILQQINFSLPLRHHRDDTPAAFDLLLEHFADYLAKEIEDFYTPLAVSKLLTDLASPAPKNNIYDPACSSGSLLLHTRQFVHEKYPSHATTFYGQENNPALALIAMMNLVINEAVTDSTITLADPIATPLLDPAGDKLTIYDIIISNPPFSITDWPYDTALQDPLKRFKLGIPPKTKGNYALILHMIASLKDTGRLVTVMPHGVLFRGAEEGKIREQIIKENLLDTVIGLPDKVLFRGNMPAAILVFKKNKADNNILFIDASELFHADRKRNLLRDEDLKTIVKAYQKRENIPHFAHLADLDEIERNAFNLNIPRYISPKIQELNIGELDQERIHLINKLASLESECVTLFDEILKELPPPSNQSPFPLCKLL